MAKLIALARNENLKLRRRKTVWVMLVLLLVFAFGFTALVGGLTGLLERMLPTDRHESFGKYCDEQVSNFSDWAESSDPEERAYFRQQCLYWKTLKDIGADWEDWRYTTDIVSEYVAAEMLGDETDAAELKTILESNDYKAYYRRNIGINEARYLGVGGVDYVNALNEGLRYCLENDIEPKSGNWKYNTAMRMSQNAMRLFQYRAAGETSSPAYENAQNEYAVAKYQLEHNIRVNAATAFKTNLLFGSEYSEEISGLWSTARSSVGMVSVVGLFGIIIAAGIVASEFGKGTVKFLLITPASRWKILLAKYCAVLLHLGMFLAVLFFANLLFAIIFCGGRDLFLPMLSASGGVVRKTSPLLKLLGLYLLEGIGVAVTSTLAFAISSLFRNSGAAVGVSMLVQFGGNLFNSILSMARADWGRYLIFANVNLSNIVDGNTYYPHQTMGTAVVVIVLHMAVFLLVAFDAFDRKEI